MGNTCHAFYYHFYLRRREGEKERRGEIEREIERKKRKIISVCWFTSPNTLRSWGWAKPKPGTQNSPQVPKMSGRTQEPEPSSRAALQTIGSWKLDQSGGGTLARNSDMGCRCPKWHLNCSVEHTCASPSLHVF